MYIFDKCEAAHRNLFRALLPFSKKHFKFIIKIIEFNYEKNQFHNNDGARSGTKISESGEILHSLTVTLSCAFTDSTLKKPFNFSFRL